MPLSNQILELTRHLNRTADLARRVQAQYTGESLSKGDHSPVTIGDLAIQASVTLALEEIDPGTPLVGEESSEELRDDPNGQLAGVVCEILKPLHGDLTADRLFNILDRGQFTPDGKKDHFWVLDPIDGTKGFLRGDQYAIALGHISAGNVTAGILCCPALSDGSQVGLVAAAERGLGAWLMDGPAGQVLRPLRVSNEDRIEHSRFCESVEAAHSSHSKAALVSKALRIEADSVRMDSQCKYFCIAAGRAEMYMRLPVRAGYVEKIWDHAAGSILVEEAGGTVTDAWGQPLEFSHGRLLQANQGVLASNGANHHLLSNTVAQVLSDSASR